VAKCRHGKLRLRWTRAHPETSRQRHYGNTQLLRRRLHRRRYKLPLRSRPPRLHCGAYRYRKRPVVSRRDFSPFGIVRNESGSVQADFAYTGHFYDPELALHHSPTRVYDAGLGRWLSADIFPDAELLPEGTNLYAYVGNDPINFTDPLGLCRSSNSRNQANRPPPKQSGNSGSGGGDPPKRTASSASPQDGKNFGKNVEVTSWAGGGRQPDLGSGRWVVKGGATRWNFFKTELGGPKTANKFPYIKGSETPFKSITRTVPASRLIKPRTSLKEPFAIIKRAFGQYQLK